MRMNRNAVLAAAVSAVLAGTGHASADTWNGGSGTWSTNATNWDGANPWTQGNNAVFNAPIGTVTLGEPITVRLVLALAAVALGIVLVNRRG